MLHQLLQTIREFRRERRRIVLDRFARILARDNNGQSLRLPLTTSVEGPPRVVSKAGEHVCGRDPPGALVGGSGILRMVELGLASRIRARCRPSAISSCS